MKEPSQAGDNPCFDGVDALAAQFRARRLSPVELASSMFARIEAMNPQLSAYYELARDAAIAAARDAEARHRAGRALGPLDGIPVSIKDHIDVAGLTSPRGHALAAAKPAATDSPLTARLREAGAVILGKTTMPELSVIPVTHTRAFGITRNPVDPSRSPGGSSGGAAPDCAPSRSDPTAAARFACRRPSSDWRATSPRSGACPTTPARPTAPWRARWRVVCSTARTR